LLIDESDIFRDYIKDKLSSMGVSVTIGLTAIDSVAKMRTNLPDLVILAFNLDGTSTFQLLDMKKADPNARDIPTIVLAQHMTQGQLNKISDYGIKKVIPKPLKIDQLFSTITEIIHIDFDIDTTPCILEARVNDNIIFVEIAQGLNREKIDLLKYKIRELVELYGLNFPKILIMMTDLSLSYLDGPNLELLLNNIIEGSGVRNRNIKILTLDSFVAQFIAGNKGYAEIQIVTDLSKAIDSLLKDASPEKDASTLISEKILSTDGKETMKEIAIEMRFKSELETLKSVARDFRIAVVDDDVVIRGVLAKTFASISATVDQFESGKSFVAALLDRNFDLIFLDLMMPEMNGIEVLVKLKERNVTTPVIVLSAISQKEAVLKVLSTGVRSYMIKPLKPDAILKKAIEVLQGSI
jgi:CheY-like chemotaxis protein